MLKVTSAGAVTGELLVRAAVVAVTYEAVSEAVVGPHVPAADVPPQPHKYKVTVCPAQRNTPVDVKEGDAVPVIVAVDPN